ncbi:unnamed protein product [Phytomonas sp. EM1]|nr:unnamed protein product [Phytomonas sp. EM1]|eukprot:CCW61906.1 unnamed protein product [Phytomonas sp. isolate EM1]
MFQEILDFALSFVGIHVENEGCTLAELGEFLDNDVFPFCGWSGNRTLRNSVVRLLVNEFSPKEITLTLHSPHPSDSLVHSVVKQNKQSHELQKNSESLKPKGSMNAKQERNANATYEMGSEIPSRKSLTPSELIHILNEEHTLWEDTSPGSISRLVHICPSLELCEKVLGVPIRTFSDRQTLSYVSENALLGCDRVIVKTKLASKYKQHTLTTGLSRMCRNQVLSVYYLMDDKTHELTCRYFPWYAAPLTELEKKELSTSSAHYSVDKNGWKPGGNLTPQWLIHQCNKKGNQPIKHYFWRMRQNNSQFPDYVFDLKAVKHAVRSSPERKLLYQDAIHTISMVHGLHPHQLNEFNKTNRMRLRRMLIAAGLRIVVVTISVRNRQREVSIVIPEEDFYKFALSNMGALKKVKTEESEVLSSVSREIKKENAEDGDKDATETGAEILNETAESSLLMQQSSLAIDAGDGESDTSSRSISASDSDDENANTSKMSGVHSKKELLEMNETRKRSEIATRTLRISPDWPFDLQFAKEAERRPIAIVAAYPRMVFYPNEKSRIKSLCLYMTNYLKRGTLETYYTLTGHNKCFTLVYAPKTEPPNSVSGAGLDGEVTEGTQLPAGTSQYAIDVVLDALKASPYKALAIRDFADFIDIRALQRRVLPYLRSTNRVTTTGITLKSKERAGIVVLAGTTLTEDEKYAVVKACREATRQPVVPGEHTQRAIAQTYGRRLKLDVLLPNIPATGDGVEKSEAHMYLSNSNSRMITMARKIMTIRNGYALNPLYRAGRLHLELWKQWHGGVYQRDSGSANDATMCSMNVQDIYDNMSLSTFCIVIGFAALDLTAVLAEHRGRDTHSTSGGVSWATPLRLLPPSVHKVCQEQGIQPLLHSLSVLQSHGLIVSDEVLDCFVTKKLRDITIALECHATDPVRRNTIVLHDRTRYTPSMTMCAVLRYWLPVWGRSVKHAVILRMSELYESESNPTIETLIALTRRMRFNVCVLAESFYQSCGMNRSLLGNTLSQESRKDAKTQLSSDLLQHDGRGRRGPTRRAMVTRRDTSGATLAKDLASVLTSPLPHRRLRSILHFLKRLSRAHLSVLPTGLPSLHDASLTSLQHHAFCVNPYANHGVVHLCALGEALQHVLQRFMPRSDSSTRVALSSLTRSFRKCINLVFSPDVSFPYMGPLIDLPCTQSSLASDDMDLQRTKTPPLPELMEASDYEEVMLDSLRMILLSDAAHYSSAIARELVLAFPAKLVARSRNYLQKEPSFNQGCWKRSHRIPELALSARPFLFTPHLTRSAPRPCANTALIHGWVASLHDTINSVSVGAIRREFQLDLSNSSLSKPHFDIIVASQPVMDVKEILLLAREDDSMATLRIPSLIWPANARMLEQGVRGGRPASLENGARKRRKRQREEYDDIDSNVMDEDIEGKFVEDEENAAHIEAPTESFANNPNVAASATLYPARTLVRCNRSDAVLADRIPTDPEPTAEETAMVKKNIARIASVKGEPQGSFSLSIGRDKSEAAYPLAYPSVFHHVDGAFHVFVWKLFLLSIYRYVLYVPGVLYTALRKRAMASGLISRRALDAALQYLVDSTVLVCKRVLTAAGDAENCYITTTRPEGLWDIINLN